MATLPYKTKTIDGLPEAVKTFYKLGVDGTYRLDVHGFYEMELAMRKERVIRRRFERRLDLCERLFRKAMSAAFQQYLDEVRKRWPSTTRA